MTSFRVAEKILELNAKFIDYVDSSNNTPLHIASYKGCQRIVSVLLNFGASVNEKNDSAMLPIHIASLYGHAEVVKDLHTRGIPGDIVDA